MSESTTVTHRDDGTTVTVTIQGNIRTTVYEKGGMVRRERFVMASDDEPSNTRRANPWGTQPMSSQGVRMVNSPSNNDGYVKRVINVPSPIALDGGGGFSSSKGASNSAAGSGTSTPVRNSAFNTIAIDSSTVPVRRSGSSGYTLPAASQNNSGSPTRSGNSPTSASTPLSTPVFIAPEPVYSSQQQIASNPFGASSQSGSLPQLVSTATLSPAPAVLVPPFEAIGIADFDVASVVKGAEYFIIDVNDAGTRYAVRGADGRIGWFPCKMVEPLPSSPPPPPPPITPTAIPPMSLEPITFSLAPPGSSGAPVNFGFLTPAPVAEARYTSLNTPTTKPLATLNDISSIVDLDAYPTRNPTNPALARPAPQTREQGNPYKAIRPLGQHPSDSDIRPGSPGLSTPSAQASTGSAGKRYDLELTATVDTHPQLARKPSVTNPMVNTVAPPSLPPAPPPPEPALDDPFAELTFHEFNTTGKSSTAPKATVVTKAPTPIKQPIVIPPAKPAVAPAPVKLHYTPQPSKPAELMSFDEIDASLAAISKQYELPAVDTSGNAREVTFDEIDASLALIAQELEQPLGASSKSTSNKNKAYTGPGGGNKNSGRSDNYSAASFGETSIIDLDGDLIMDDIELDSLIMEEELARGFNELQSLQKEAELERRTIEERERVSSQLGPSRRVQPKAQNSPGATARR